MLTNSLLASFSALLLVPSFSRVDSLFGHEMTRCQFSSDQGHDSVYLEQFYFNKILLWQYNSTLGKFTGNTEKAMEIAETYNKDPAIMAHQRGIAEHCKRHIPHTCDVFLKPAEPYIRLRSVEAASSRHPAVLICSAYDFYPKQIIVTWLRNGKEEASDVTSTVKLPNGNWLYQVHSYLEFTPRPGEKITCMVEHASLREPKLYDWDPKTESEKNKIVVGTAGLLLGVVFSVAGLIYYKKNSRERMLVPTQQGRLRQFTFSSCPVSLPETFPETSNICHNNQSVLLVLNTE